MIGIVIVGLVLTIEQILNLNSHNKIRKLSVTVSLSDQTEYEGNIPFLDNKTHIVPVMVNNPVKCKEIISKGSLVVFPSFVWHRVCPVKRGERKSLVIWNLGLPWK